MWKIVHVMIAAGLAMWASPQSDKAAPVTVVGHFDATVSDGEHRSGYALSLWRAGDAIVGFLIVPRGLAGDPPTGLLENVTLGSNGELFFTAKVPGGWITSEIPAVDDYEFNGVLEPDMVKGTLQFVTSLPNAGASEQRITLRRSRDMTEVMRDYPAYKAWEAYAARILRRRGPRQAA
jgi:hypothetical protein